MTQPTAAGKGGDAPLDRRDRRPQSRPSWPRGDGTACSRFRDLMDAESMVEGGAACLLALDDVKTSL